MPDPKALRVCELFAQHVFGCLVGPWSRGCVRGGELLLHRQAELLITLASVAILEARMPIVYGSRDCRSAREQRQGYHERGHYEDQ